MWADCTLRLRGILRVALRVRAVRLSGARPMSSCGDGLLPKSIDGGASPPPSIVIQRQTSLVPLGKGDTSALSSADAQQMSPALGLAWAGRGSALLSRVGESGHANAIAIGLTDGC